MLSEIALANTIIIAARPRQLTVAQLHAATARACVDAHARGYDTAALTMTVAGGVARCAGVSAKFAGYSDLHRITRLLPISDGSRPRYTDRTIAAICLLAVDGPAVDVSGIAEGTWLTAADLAR